MKLCSKCKVDHTYTSSAWCKLCKKEAAKAKRLIKGQKPRVIYDNPPGQKICRYCKAPKDLDQFHKADPRHSVLGVGPYCKECRPLAVPVNKEKARLATRLYRFRHRARYLLAHRVAQAKRRGLIIEGNLANEDAEKIYNKEFCRYCKVFIEIELRTAEHILPLSRGGRHEISNIDMACLSCNCSKRNRTEEEFLFFLEKRNDNRN